MAKKFFLGMFFSAAGILFAAVASAQVCPHIYQGINCGANWYCGGCQAACKTCPGVGDPIGATQLNYVSCGCSCPAGQIVCSGACGAAPACSTPSRVQDNSSCNGCGVCAAGYSPDPDHPDAPNPCIKAAYMNYANSGDFKLTGSSSGDLYMASGKAIRVDGDTTTTLNIGNWGNGLNINLNLLGGFIVGSPAGGAKGKGTVNAEQLCMQGICRNTWPEATTAFVDEGNVGFGPTAVLGTNDNVPLVFKTNNANRVYIDTSGRLGVGVPSPAYPLDVSGVGNFSGNLRVGMGSADDDDYVYFDDGTKYIKWENGMGRFNFSSSIFSQGMISGSSFNTYSGGDMAAYDITNQKSIRIRHDGTNGIVETYTAFGIDTGNLVLQSTSPGRNVTVNDDLSVNYGVTVGAVANMGTGALNTVQLCISGDCKNAWPAGTIGGAGTTNYLAKFTAGSTIGNSQIFDSGSNVGVGTAVPSYKLDVNGTINTSSSLTVAGTAGLGGLSPNVNYGISAQGATMGGYLKDSVDSGYAYVGYGNYGVYASGSSIAVYAVGGTYGVYGSGTSYGGYFSGNLLATGDTTLKGKLTVGTAGSVSGAISLYPPDGTAWFHIDAPGGATGSLRFSQGATPGATPLMTILQNGNVGIGNTSPSYKLDVTGDINATGNVKSGNGTNVVYRCTVAGALPVGAMTINSANCGASTDTGLRVK